MKYALALLALCCVASTLLAEDEPKVPEGIRYKKASAEINEKAKQKLVHLFSDKATDDDVLAAFEKKVVICGPGLWGAIKNDAAMAKVEGGVVTFAIPIRDAAGKVTQIQEMKGKLFQSNKDLLAFWKVLSASDNYADATIRKLNPDELRLFWAMIAFDITEPTFIVESKNHKILVAFTSPEKMSICWIDDFQKLHLDNDEAKREKPPEAKKE